MSRLSMMPRYLFQVSSWDSVLKAVAACTAFEKASKLIITKLQLQNFIIKSTLLPELGL